MNTMRFVTQGARLRDLREARRDLGVTQGTTKEAKWGKPAIELIAETRRAQADTAVA
jgi:hypothetical protein